jgi:hypothetical protein
MLVQARVVAFAIFGIPVPGTGEDEYDPKLEEPIRVYLRIGPAVEMAQCDPKFISIRQPGSSIEVTPARVAMERHNQKRGVHYCGFDFVPLKEIGDEFDIHISRELLGCDVAPLRLKRDESVRCFGANRP